MAKASEPSSDTTGLILRGENGRMTLTPEGLGLLERMSRGGHGLRTIAKALGTSHSGLDSIRKRQPEAQEAVETGRAGLEDELAGLLLEKARKGNVTCAIFLLKAQCGWREGERPDRTPNVAVQVNLGSALSEKAYAEAIDVEAQQ